MGEESSDLRNKEVSELLDYGYNLYQSDVYITKDEVIDNVKIEKSKEKYTSIVPIKDVTIVNKKGHLMGEISYELKLDNITSPINKGEKIGTLTIKEDNIVVNTVDVTVDESVEKASIIRMYFRNLFNIFTLFN